MAGTEGAQERCYIAQVPQQTECRTDVLSQHNFAVHLLSTGCGESLALEESSGKVGN